MSRSCDRAKFCRVCAKSLYVYTKTRKVLHSNHLKKICFWHVFTCRQLPLRAGSIIMYVYCWGQDDRWGEKFGMATAGLVNRRGGE